jgi:hypothetical protein
VAKAATKKPEPKSLLTIIDCVQGSELWHREKIGIPSASNFATIMASGRDGGASVTRTKLLHRMATEVITGEPVAEGFKSAAMERGNQMEAEVRESYSKRKNVEVQQVGFAKNFAGLMHAGASPDGLLGFDGGLEIKTAEGHVLIPLLDRPQSAVMDHRWQIQGNMWIFERNWWDLCVYCHPKMPKVDVRIDRDEAMIRQISEQVQTFNFDLKRLIEKLRSMGA